MNMYNLKDELGNTVAENVTAEEATQLAQEITDKCTMEGGPELYLVDLENPKRVQGWVEVDAEAKLFDWH